MLHLYLGPSTWKKERFIHPKRESKIILASPILYEHIFSLTPESITPDVTYLCFFIFHDIYKSQENIL